MIPQRLKDEIDKINFTETQRHHALSIVLNDILYTHRPKTVNGYVELPKNFLNKKYGSYYHGVMKLLRQHNIIESDDSYSTDHHYCKSYRIRPDILTGRLQDISYVKKYREAEFSETESKTYEILKKLELDYTGAKTRLKKYIKEKEYYKNLLIGDQIQDPVFLISELSDNGDLIKRYRMGRENALNKAKALNKEVIKDDGRFWLVDISIFEKFKEREIIYSHIRKLRNIQKGIHYAHINNTNYRLDTTITNLPNIYIPYLRLEGEELINIDIKNSQMWILSLLITQTHNLKEEENPRLHNVREFSKVVEFIEPEEKNSFFELAGRGQLYEWIQAKSNLPTRSIAKKSCFQVLFSSQNFRGGVVRAFRKAFPSLFRAISLFKSRQGYKSFPILLQRLESTIVVGKVLPELFKRGINTLTKHDSFLCKKSEIKFALDSIMHIFAEYQLNPLFSVEQ